MYEPACGRQDTEEDLHGLSGVAAGAEALRRGAICYPGRNDDQGPVSCEQV